MFKIYNYEKDNLNIINNFNKDWFRMTSSEFLVTGMYVDTIGGSHGKIVDIRNENDKIIVFIKNSNGKYRPTHLNSVNYSFSPALHNNSQCVVMLNNYGFIDVEGMWNDISSGDSFDSEGWYDFATQCSIFKKNNEIFLINPINEFSDEELCEIIINTELKNTKPKSKNTKIGITWMKNLIRKKQL